MYKERKARIMKRCKNAAKRTKSITKALVLITTAIIIAFCFYTLFMNYSVKNKEESFIATVNGDQISVREFKNALINLRTDIFTYFNQKYGAEISNDFWTRTFNGEVPIELVKRKALDNCIKVRIQYALAKREGILQDTSYSSFLRSLDEENNRRKAAIEKKQVIYGPVQYSESNYFAYTLSNLTSKLINKLDEKELKAEESELKLFYEKNKERYTQPYSEVKDNVKLMHANAKFEELLIKLAKEAKIEINKPIYEWVKVD